MRFQQGETTYGRPGDPIHRRLVVLMLFGAVVVLAAFGFHAYMGRISEEAIPAGLVPDSGEGVPVKIQTGSEPEGATPFPPIPLPPPQVSPAEPFVERDVWTLAATFDYTDRIYTDGLVYVLQQIRNDPSWSNERPPGVTRDSTRVRELLLKEPGEHRGEAVFVEGNLIAADRGASPVALEALPAGNPSGLDRYFQSFLFNGKQYFMIAFWRPPETPFRDRDAVQVRGRFLQVYQYDIVVRGRPARYAVPVIVSDSISRHPSATEPYAGFKPLYVFLVGFGGACLVVLLAILWIFQRGNREYEEKMARIRARLASRRGVEKSAPPSGGGRESPGQDATAKGEAEP